MWFFSRPDASVVTEIHDLGLYENDDRPQVIFVHGLDGDPFKTWNFHAPENWRTWILDELGHGVHLRSLRYRLRSSRWLGGSMPLEDRANNVLATLGKGKAPLVFVCHSYGGLLVKQMLRNSLEPGSPFPTFAKRVKLIVFLATPHNGSAIPNYIGALKSVIRTGPAVEELRANSSQLRALSTWFRNSVVPNGWKLQVYFETMDTFGVRVVDEGSADPQIAGVAAIPVDADHISIVKPPQADFRVRDLVSELQALTQEQSERERVNADTLLRRMLSDPTMIPLLTSEAEARTRADPRDMEAQMFLGHVRRTHEERQNAGPVRSATPAYENDRYERISWWPFLGLSLGAAVGWWLFPWLWHIAAAGIKAIFR